MIVVNVSGVKDISVVLESSFGTFCTIVTNHLVGKGQSQAVQEGENNQLITIGRR